MFPEAVKGGGEVQLPGTEGGLQRWPTSKHCAHLNISKKCAIHSPPIQKLFTTTPPRAAWYGLNSLAEHFVNKYSIM